MDIQTRKLHFIQEYLRLTDESLIDKLNILLRSERKKKIEKDVKPYSNEEFNEMINCAESDSENNRITSATELDKEVDSWN